MPATKRLSISEFHRLVAVSEPAGGEEALPRGPSGDVGRRAVPGTRRWISKGDGDMQLVVSELAVPEGSGAPVVETVEGFKQAFDLIVDEYLNGFDASEACRCVLELQAPQFHFQVVKRGVLRAMDEADRERELIAILLSCLHERGTLTAEQVAAGFRAILADLDDLTIDMPTATPLLAHFLADAVLDGLLPRAELARWAADFSAAPAAAAALDGAALRLGGHRGGAETSPGEVAALRREVGSVVEEYLCSHDVAEVRRRLGEMSLPAELQHNVVRVAVELALDRTDQQRELISRLLCALAHAPLEQRALARGFEVLLSHADGLTLDIPATPALLAAFLVRAVADDVLPPAFVKQLPPEALVSERMRETLSHARAQLAAAHFSGRRRNVWGRAARGAAVGGVEDLKVAVSEIVRELFSSGEEGEALRCVRELHTPAFHHELVKRLIVGAIDVPRREQELAVGLVQRMVTEQVLSPEQLCLGRQRAAEGAEDLRLDNPRAPELIADFLERLPG